MNKPQKYTAIKFELSLVSWHISRIVSTLLNKEFEMQVKSEDDCYWSAISIGTQFSIVEVMDLIKAVDGDDEMIYQSIPTDSNKTRCLSMHLCQALLKRDLKVTWENEFVTEDALWIILDKENAEKMEVQK